MPTFRQRLRRKKVRPTTHVHKVSAMTQHCLVQGIGETRGIIALRVTRPVPLHIVELLWIQAVVLLRRKGVRAGPCSAESGWPLLPSAQDALLAGHAEEICDATAEFG